MPSTRRRGSGGCERSGATLGQRKTAVTSQRSYKGVAKRCLIAWLSAVMALTVSYRLGLAVGCEGHPDAIGTSSVLSVDPSTLHRVGSKQYPEVLPLQDHEVVLTFDDGPLPPHTENILKTLASNCAKATFFIVGEMARQFPDLLRRAYDEGHTIGTHTQTIPICQSCRAARQNGKLTTALRRLPPY